MRCAAAPEHPYSRLGAQKSLRWRNRRKRYLTPAARSYTVTYSRRTSVSRRLAHCVQPGLARRKYRSGRYPHSEFASSALADYWISRRTLRQRRCANATSTWKPQKSTFRNWTYCVITRRNFARSILRVCLITKKMATAVRRAVANSDKLRHDHHARLFRAGERYAVALA